MSFDGLAIDTGRREVRVDGVAVELTALEFDLLVALAAAPGRVYTRRLLLERVWGWDHVGDERVVDVHVRILRRALGDDAADPSFMGTVRGVGYRFMAAGHERRWRSAGGSGAWRYSSSRAAASRCRPGGTGGAASTSGFASYAAVAATGATALLVSTRLLVPRLFDRRVGHAGFHGPAGTGSAMHDAMVGSLDRALAVALLASVVAAAAMTVFVGRRILRPIGRVRAATRRLAAGHYDQRIDPPAEAELAGLAGDVNALARVLDDTERRRARLVSDVAHELRTPLTTIRGYAEGMLDGVIPPDHDVLTAVLDHVERLERLAADLGTLSRADEGRLELQLAPVDIAALARSVVSGFQVTAGDKGVQLGTTGAHQVVTMADRDRRG